MADYTVNIKENTNSAVGGGLTESGGQDLTMGAVADGELLKRSGTTIIGGTAPAPEGTAVLSTGETGGTKFLREDGDGTCSWQAVAGGSGGTVQNVNLSIEPTDDGTVAGNARGTNCVDLQTTRALATQVATGTTSIIAGGDSNLCYGINGNTVSGGYLNLLNGFKGDTIAGGSTNKIYGANESTANSGIGNTISGGQSNTISGGYGYDSTISGGYGNSVTNSGYYTSIGGGNGNSCSALYGFYNFIGGGTGNQITSGDKNFIGGGVSNSASGGSAVVCGGANNTASAYGSTVIGGIYGKADKHGQVAYASGRFSVDGDAQHSTYVLRRSQASMAQNTWYNLGLNGSDPSSSAVARLTLASDQIITATGTIVGATAGLAAKYGAKFEFVASNDGGTTALQASTVTDIHDSGTDIEAQIVIDDTNDYVTVQVRTTGVGTPTMRFVAVVDAVELTYA